MFRNLHLALCTTTRNTPRTSRRTAICAAFPTRLRAGAFAEHGSRGSRRLALDNQRNRDRSFRRGRSRRNREIQNPVSQYTRTTTTDTAGKFTFPNVPFNPYHMTVNVAGFAPYAQDIDVRSAVPLNVKVDAADLGDGGKRHGAGRGGRPGGERSDLPHRHRSPTVRQAATGKHFIGAELAGHFGIARRRRRFQRPVSRLGDHAENSFSLDGQPITDQQSKVFSNQIPLDAVQSMQVIAGAPPAEYGDKTSLVIDVTTRSGLGSTTPHGEHHHFVRHFGTSNVDA